MSWTDVRVEILKKLWSEGLSASQIAKELGRVTRNAVIGKVHRLGLSGRSTPSRPPSRVVRTAPSRPVRPAILRPPVRAAALAVTLPDVVVYIDPEQVDGEFVSLADLGENICKWPIGDPSDVRFQFCGRKTGCGSPYCDAHKRIAYNPPKRKRRQPESAVDALNAIAATRRATW